MGECHNHAGYRVHKEDETEFKSTLTGNIGLNTGRAHSTRQEMIILSIRSFIMILPRSVYFAQLDTRKPRLKLPC